MKISRNVFLGLIAVAVIAVAFYVRRHYYYPIVNKSAGSATIVALGDSLTYGTGAGQGEDWPSLVSAMSGKKIINKGVPGETTADALARLDSSVLALDPTIVVVGLGGNDILQRLSEEELFKNLRTIVMKTQSSGAMVVVLGLNGFPFGGSLKSGYAKIARETGSVLIPDVLGGILTNPKLKSDQIHPNAAGYKLMAEKIYSRLKPYL